MICGCANLPKNLFGQEISLRGHQKMACALVQHVCTGPRRRPGLAQTGGQIPCQAGLGMLAYAQVAALPEAETLLIDVSGTPYCEADHCTYVRVLNVALAPP